MHRTKYHLISSSPVVLDTFPQASRFVVSLSPVTTFLNSSSRSQNQVFLGRPLFLFRLGFQMRDGCAALSSSFVWGSR
ncbi:hypothetical protein DPMN_055813 [Dreissena polymorpha]|uniref:Uncharacterized protein n=1 Tax=Dreissena polymorpha TaxID=45954 RepID=A0A9D4HT18_DREPO|nr:hypothetical protein DPMN_055813 [Dreissena polymorpha]